MSLLNHGETSAVSGLVVGILAFIPAHVSTFTEICISPYGFEVLSRVPSCHPQGALEHFLWGGPCAHKLLGLCLAGNV